MSTEHFQSSEAEETAPVAADTTPAEAVDTGASEDQEQEEQQEERTFTQKELNDILGQRLAEDRRKRAREEQQKAAQPIAPSVEPPKADQYKDANAYFDAVSTWKAQHIAFDNAKKDQERQTIQAFEDRAEKLRTTKSDIDIIFAAPKDGGPATTDHMAAVIWESEIGPEIAYHLAKNPDEALRICNLTPLAQAREIGKIEAALAPKPPAVKKPSSAPEPITPVGSRTHTPTYDTTDPKSIKTMSTSEWIAAENKRRAKLDRR